MASFNRVILVGNLTRDVELRYTPQQTAVTDIGLAVNERIKRNNEWVEEVNFFDVTLWGRTAEVASEYLSKGSSILIEGRLKMDSWEQDGQKRHKMKIVGERMQMLGGKSGGGGGGGGPKMAESRNASHSTSSVSNHDSSVSNHDDDGAPSPDDVPF